MSKSWTKTAALVAMLCMILSTTDVYAGPGSGKKQMGFFAKVGKAIKKASHKAAMAVKKAAVKTANAIKNGVKTAAKKVEMGIKTAGAKVTNGIMDTGVWAKQKLFGKKNKVWVCGHYDKNGKYIKGHWRKLNAGKPSAGGNTASQSAGGDNGGDNYFTGTPSNDDQGLSGDGNSFETSGTPAEETPAEEAPVAGEDPAIPEIPTEENTDSEQSAQTSQESEQTSQAAEQFSYDQEVSTRTMGMLMDDIVNQSKSINEFKRTANANINYSVELSEDVNTTYEAREDDASLLARIVVWDIQVNNGQSGKYYNFFLSRLAKLDPQSRALVKDVVVEIRAGIVHNSNNAATDEEKAVYNKRLSELSKY